MKTKIWSASLHFIFLEIEILFWQVVVSSKSEWKDKVKCDWCNTNKNMPIILGQPERIGSWGLVLTIFLLTKYICNEPYSIQRGGGGRLYLPHRLVSVIMFDNKIREFKFNEFLLASKFFSPTTSRYINIFHKTEVQTVILRFAFCDITFEPIKI